MGVSSFHLFGTLGFLLGTTLGIYLAIHENLSLWVLLLMSLIGAIQLFAHTMIHKIITGGEELIYYRHEIAIMLLCWLVLSAIGQPVLPFLDICLLGVGAFLAFGRLGCYNVGCCYGRPCKSGVKYTDAHAKQGFPFYWVGIPLLPVQLIESAGVAITVVIGTWAMLQKLPYGTALICYTVLYGGLRFVLEFFRGDPERPYWGGFSEAQWTTLALFVFTAICSWVGWLPYYPWHTIALLTLAVSMLVLGLIKRNKILQNKLTTPQHIQEIALGLKGLRDIGSAVNPASTPVAQTSAGLKISAGIIRQEDHVTRHYTISLHQPQKNKFVLDEPSVRSVARLIQMFQLEKTNFKIRKGQHEGVYHVLFEQ